MTPAAFAQRNPAAIVESHVGDTMGTSWSLHGVAAGFDMRAVAEAGFARVISQMSQWDAQSTLAQFNRARAGDWFPIPAEFLHVIMAAQQIGRASGGAFHPALGEWSEAWGFGTAAIDGKPQAVQRPLVPINAIGLDPQTSSISRQQGALLDLSGIAKGFAVDLVAEHLLARGMRHFLIEIGGELRGEGIEPSGQPWWVDIEMPPTSNVAPYRVALHDISIATSGNYRRGIVIDHQHYSHSFDPRTGMPIAHGTSSVTVLHRSCMMADGWATAFTVMKAAEAMKLAAQLDIALCIVAGDREWTSPAWRAMLD
ncbi:FAD:protein FMN transferase [Sphingopyxis yananensis]|uniref:FAD:protein FMN transferase n=1 Tax=Sphingopyxis yananensis TaxID=2886687 RepID=UPI001D10EF10|nr:FAD:protein FMN transferase [Sphingopyxis yananensis]MCC2600961.1 FAD:protein FMN transferase [Sphingopyxis yananensis]